MTLFIWVMYGFLAFATGNFIGHLQGEDYVKECLNKYAVEICKGEVDNGP